MTDVVSTLRAGGYTDQEIAEYMTDLRDRYHTAGFNDDEIDDHLGIPRTPATIPVALTGRLAAGTEARQREGGLIQTIPQFVDLMSSPEGRTKLWNQVKQFPEDFVEGLKFPGKVATGEVDLSTPEGMDQAIGFGAMIGLTHGAPGAEIPKLTRANAPAFLRSRGAEVARIDRDGAGNITDVPIGGLPEGVDIQNASRVMGNGDTTPLMEQKFGALYQGYGLHPAEVVMDAARDPVVAQKILSVDPGDLPYDQLADTGYQFHGYETEVPEKILETAERMREAGIPASVQEPYFKDVIRGARAKYPDAMKVPFTVDEGLPEHGIAPGESFEVPKHLGTEQELREKVLLEGQDVEYDKAQAQILSKINIGGETPTRTLTWDKLYRLALDRGFPLQKEADLANLTPESNPYVLYRLMAGWAGKADHFLNQGTFDFTTGENNGASLKQVLSPVAADLNGFNAYGAASRAVELEGRGIKSGFAAEGGNLDAARSVLINGFDKYEKPFRAAVDYQNRVFQYLHDSGVISDSVYAKSLELNKQMFPFARVMGYEDGPMAVGGSMQARNPVKRIEGSGRDIINPTESIVRNTYHLIEMAERNRVGTAAIDMLTAMGKAFPKSESLLKQTITKRLENMDAIADELRAAGVTDPNEFATTLAHAAQPDEPGTISILRDGKRITYEVDPEIAAAMKGLNAETASWWVKLLAGPANLLRAGAVLTPEFWGRHIVRDFLYAKIRGDISLTDYPRAALGLIMKDEAYWNWLKGGGGNVSVASLNRRYLQENLRELTNQTGLMTRAWNTLADPEASMWAKATAVPRVPFQAISKYALDPLRAGTEFAENLSHFAAFRKAMAEPDQALPAAQNMRERITRAGWISRDTAVDAARMGAAIKTYNSIFAFGNIKLQDSDVMAGAIKRSPAKTLTKIMLSVTLPSVALWALNHDDPDYQELPQWEKDLFWIVPIGSEAPSPLHVKQAQERGVAPTNSAKFFMRIPKPWATGLVFGSVPERLLDAYAAENPRAFKDLFKNLFETVGPEFFPTAVQPMWEQFANRSTFTNRTLIPQAQEKFLPEYQYTPYTTELAKSLGQVLGAFPGMKAAQFGQQPVFTPVARAITSPILMENYIREWTGTLGVYTLNAADAALRDVGILPDPPQPARTLADIPFIKAFVVRYPTATTESIQNFYDRYEYNQSLLKTWTDRLKDGDVVAMQQIQKLGGTEMFVQLDGIARALSTQQKLIRDIYKNPSIQPDQKRQLIDQTYYSMIQTAMFGNRVLDNAEKERKRR